MNNVANQLRKRRLWFICTAGLSAAIAAFALLRSATLRVMDAQDRAH